MTSGADIRFRFSHLGGAVISLEWLDVQGGRIYPPAGRISAVAASVRLQRRSGHGLISVVVDVADLSEVAPKLTLPKDILEQLLPPARPIVPAEEQAHG